MLNYFKKHKIAVGIIVLALLVIFCWGTWMRGQILKNSTETKLDNPKRAEQVIKDDFYELQLTQKEKAAYEIMKTRIENFEGGVVEFSEPLNGREYTRVLNTVENSDKDYFYGFFEIPMTNENQYVKYKEDSLDKIKESIISKCILFQLSAKDLSQSGEFDDEGYVTNLKEIEAGITETDEEKKQKILEKEAKIDEILNQVVSDLPKEYGTKDAINYFLKWMKDNLSYATGIEQEADSIKTMEHVLEKVYVCNNTSAVLDGYALTNGYAKILKKLCNLSGIEAHTVTGIWHKKDAYTLTCVKFGDQRIYIDAAGKYTANLGNQRYLNELEAKNHLAFVEYFDYES